MRSLALRMLLVSLMLMGLAVVMVGNVTYGAQGECGRATAVKNAVANAIMVDAHGSMRKKIGAEYFGFNLVWTGFQRSHWHSSTQQIEPEIIEWMSAFPGAVYRYDSINSWRDTTGLTQNRPSRKVESWAAPTVANFGYDEYLGFVAQVKGQAWVIANISGVYEGELPANVLASDAADWLLYSESKRLAGQPAVLRWELGNELDRGKNPWPPEKYAGNASVVAKKMALTKAKPRFVAMLEDYDAFKGKTSSQYNRQVIQALSPEIQDFAQHLYYDGSPGGPPIPNRLGHLCKSIEDVYSVRPDIKPTFWITEHARTPPGQGSDWQKNWWRSVNLEGALGVADMMIATTQVPEVQGVFLHSMEGTASPWPLFHRLPDGRLQASAVYYALSILRSTLLDEVLQTKTESRWDSAYFGHYDFRSTVLTNAARNKYSVWSVNRNGIAIQPSLRIPALAGKRLQARVHVLADDDVNATNAKIWSRLRPKSFDTELIFDATGKTLVTLPPYSVSAISLAKVN